jgi:hypothetical protein
MGFKVPAVWINETTRTLVFFRKDWNVMEHTNTTTVHIKHGQISRKHQSLASNGGVSYFPGISQLMRDVVQSQLKRDRFSDFRLIGIVGQRLDGERDLAARGEFYGFLQPVAAQPLRPRPTQA